ncbi:MAG: outer membrane protein transport protein [Proteobacteria bacterium]|uniref:OmpP1/FadL family transporter n=1 Tax=Aquabacterium sp. TaxID=1872578 RepID=UPI0035C72421|nr:outer membrane protein transport protein [Pseudomonadota bacterium]
MSHAKPFLSRLTAIAALVGVSAPLSALATNGYFAHGYGVQSLGAAGVAVALPQDALVIASNPAGISQLSNRADVGLTLFSPRRDATIEGSPVPGLNGHYSGDGKKNFWIPELGYVRQLQGPLTFGLALYGNGGMNTRYERNPYAALGGQGRAGVNLEQIFISPALSYKLTPQHSVGLALNLVHQRFAAKGLQGFDQAGYTAAPGNVTNVGTDTSNGFGLRLGWLGQITPELKVGASWSSKVRGRFDKYQGLFADHGNFDIPSSFGLGLSYQLTPAWQVAADYQRILYSQTQSVGNPLQRFLEGKQLGNDGGPGFGWKDIGVVKLAVIHRYSDALTLRAGYSHAQQPIPRDQTFFNVLAPGVVQDHLTAGFTWKLNAHGSVSAYAAHAFSKTVSGQNAIPASLLGGGEANIRMKENILGVAYGWTY